MIAVIVAYPLGALLMWFVARVLSLPFKRWLPEGRLKRILFITWGT